MVFVFLFLYNHVYMRQKGLFSFLVRYRALLIFIMVFSFVFAPFSFSHTASKRAGEVRSVSLTPQTVFAYPQNVPGLDSYEESQSESGRGREEAATNVEEYMQCNITKGSDGFTGCLALATYYLLYMPASFILGAVGNFFDIVLLFSISKTLIDQEFVKTVWTNVRDLANMAFIFILLWIAIATILRVRNNAAKDLLTKLIIIALLVNFSLFISRVIVDAGNMFSMFFYDGFTIEKTQNVKGEGNVISGNSIAKDSFIDDWVGDEEIKGVSGAFIHYTDINRMIKLEGNLVKAQGGTWWKLWTDQVTPPAKQHFNLIIYFLLSAALMGVLAWVLFTSSFLFITRVAILWLLMAVSPLAFVGMILPQSRGYVQKHFWSELISKSFCVTVFLFLLWFTLQFLKGAETWNNFGAHSEDLLAVFVIVLLKFTVLTAILFYAKNTAKKMCDSIGGVSLDIGKKLAGLAGGALGLAAGGIGGAALRKFVGGTAANLAGNKGLRQSWGQNWAGRLALRGMDNAAKSSFDIRGTKLGGTLGTNKGVGAWGMKRGEGGYTGKAEARKKELEKLSTSFGDKDDPNAIAARKKLADKLERKSLPTLQKVGMSWRKGGAIGDSIVGGMMKTFGSAQMQVETERELNKRADERKEADEKSLEKHKDMRGAQSAGQKGAAGAAKTILKQVKAGEQMQIEKERDKERFDKEKDALLARKGDKDDMAQSILQRLPDKDAAPESWKAGTEDALGDLNRTLRGINVALKQEAKREKDLMTTLGGLSTDERTGSQGRDIERQLRESRDKTLANEERKIEFEETKKDLERLSKRAEKESRNLRKVFESSGGNKKDAEKK